MEKWGRPLRTLSLLTLDITPIVPDCSLPCSSGEVKRADPGSLTNWQTMAVVKAIEVKGAGSQSDDLGQATSPLWAIGSLATKWR